VPAMGDSITEGTVAAVLKQPGVARPGRTGEAPAARGRPGLGARARRATRRRARRPFSTPHAPARHPGDAVAEDDVIAQIETDKARGGGGAGVQEGQAGGWRHPAHWA
jgi:hypothetical protein